MRLEYLPGLEQRGLALQLQLGKLVYSGQAGGGQAGQVSKGIPPPLPPPNSSWKSSLLNAAWPGEYLQLKLLYSGPAGGVQVGLMSTPFPALSGRVLLITFYSEKVANFHKNDLKTQKQPCYGFDENSGCRSLSKTYIGRN